MNISTVWIFVVVSLPLMLLIALVDYFAGVRAKYTAGNAMTLEVCEDFAVLVPIYGSFEYLENADFLADYADRVLLCTTTSESPEFYEGLRAVAGRYGFGIFYGEGDPRAVAGAKRSTGGTTRDRLVRDALAIVTQPWVVCIDADTRTERPLGELIGAARQHNFDVVSVPLVPSNSAGWLARLQAHEYRLAMSVRRIIPWLVSGACHAGRTEALAHTMQCHSMFFQGNDVETGLVAGALGYRVGHIPFVVPTTVPSKARDWFRQRYAWSGGEFRLFVVNFKLIRRHPALWLYGAGVMFAGVFFRWYTIVTVPMALVCVFIIYLALLAYVNWPHRDWYLLAMPFYALLTSLVIVPLAAVSYLGMAWTARNAGVILPRSKNQAALASLAR